MYDTTPKTPYERFTGRPAEYAHIIKFGEPVHVLKNGEYITKFEPRTWPGFLVGFTTRRNTCRIYLPHNHKVIETSDVIVAPHRKQDVLGEAPTNEQKIIMCNCNQTWFNAQEQNYRPDNREPKNQQHLCYEM
jgi:hypothetical protein